MSETSADAQPAYAAPLITPEEAAARFANGAVVIDVRSDAGRAQDGTIPVAEQLRQKGFTNVAHVEGGFPAWRDAGAPSER